VVLVIPTRLPRLRRHGASYGEVVYRNDAGPDGRRFRIMATGAF
jgi:hypothetical protein